MKSEYTQNGDGSTVVAATIIMSTLFALIKLTGFADITWTEVLAPIWMTSYLITVILVIAPFEDESDNTLGTRIMFAIPFLILSALLAWAIV